MGGSLRRPNDANSADYPSFRSLAVISVPILPDPDDDSRSLVETLIKEQGRVVLTPAQDQAYGRLTQRFLELRLGDPLAASCSEGAWASPNNAAADQALRRALSPAP